MTTANDCFRSVELDLAKGTLTVACNPALGVFTVYFARRRGARPLGKTFQSLAAMLVAYKSIRKELTLAAMLLTKAELA